MARTRDIIREITDVRQRQRFGLSNTELRLRLSALERAFIAYDKNHAELIRYFPVSLIACVEGYFRMAIKDLIDAGEPYLTNSEKLASSLKLDFSLLRAVHGKTITVGELVAHGVKLSGLEYVEAAISSVLGKGFLDSLRETVDRWEHEVMGKPSVPILSKPDEVFADVAKTFELRHVICHEIASAYEIEFEEVARCFKSCVVFLKAADAFISQTMYPDAPLTQTAMNIAAGKALREKREQLQDAVEALKARLGKTELVAFDESQAKWQSYCEAWTEFVAGKSAGGGTIWPTIYAGVAESVVERRLDEIKGFKRFGE